MSATELARLLATRSSSALEMTNVFLERTRQLNPRLNAFVYVSPSRARMAAALWDRSHRRGRQPESPLSGVPVGIKDLALVRGMPNRFGSRAFPPIPALRDGVVTRRVRRAGMIILGKLSTSEFGAMPVTEPDIHAPTRNPHALDFTAGGSSGGSGAAVASGMLPIAQGSDGAGSIRIPSALNHLVGLKTSRGLIAHVTPVDRELRLAVVGPMAKTVEDLAAFLDCTTDEFQDFLSAYRKPLPSQLRVAISTESPIRQTQEVYQSAARRVATILADSGAAVEERPWLDVPVDDFLTVWKRAVANVPWLRESRLQPVTAWLRREGLKVSRGQALQTRRKLEAQVLSWFGDYDLWISPTMAIKAPRIGAWCDLDPERSFDNVMGMGVYTAGYNISGLPAITVPMGFDSDGVPVGVQVAAPLGHDGRLLQVARLIEDAVGGFRASVSLQD